MQDPDVFLKAYIEKQGDVLSELIDTLITRKSIPVSEGIKLLLKNDIVEEEILKKRNTEKILKKLKDLLNKYISHHLLDEHTLYYLYDEIKESFSWLFGEELSFDGFKNWLES